LELTVEYLASSSRYYEATPSDTVDFPHPSRQLTVLTDGDIVIVRTDDTVIGPLPVIAGMVFNIAAKRLNAATDARVLVLE